MAFVLSPSQIKLKETLSDYRAKLAHEKHDEEIAEEDNENLDVSLCLDHDYVPASVQNRTPKMLIFGQQDPSEEESLAVTLSPSLNEKRSWSRCRLALSAALATEVVDREDSGASMPTDSAAQLYDLLYLMQQTRLKLVFRIPDLFIIQSGQIGAHLFTSKQGQILRKTAANMDARTTCQRLVAQTVDGRYNFEKYVALVQSDPPHLLRLEQFEKLRDRMIANEVSRGNDDLFLILQKFIKPKNDLGYECCVVRRSDSLWVHHSTFRYSRRYRSKSDMEMQERLEPEGRRGMEIFHPVPEAIANEAERITALMLRFFWKMRSSLDILSCEFIQDYTGKLFLHRMTRFED